VDHIIALEQAGHDETANMESRMIEAARRETGSNSSGIAHFREDLTEARPASIIKIPNWSSVSMYWPSDRGIESGPERVARRGLGKVRLGRAW
jgi:hypothetical protein